MTLNLRRASSYCDTSHTIPHNSHGLDSRSTYLRRRLQYSIDYYMQIQQANTADCRHGHLGRSSVGRGNNRRPCWT
jgi:hypothetical protein